MIRRQGTIPIDADAPERGQADPAERVSRLLAAWPPPSAEQEQARAEFLSFLAAHGPQAVHRDLRVGHLTASTLLLDDAHERVLLTLHPLAGRWFQLGGHVEPEDASVTAAALREATEESGIEGITLTERPLRLDRHPTRCRDSAGRLSPSVHWDVQHVAVAPPGAMPRRSHESDDLDWFALDALPDGGDPVVRGLIAEARARGLA